MSPAQSGGEDVREPPDPIDYRKVNRYVVAVAVLAGLLTIVSVVLEPLVAPEIRPLVVLLLLGILSATTLDYDNEGVNYSFTSFVLVSSLPLTGPTGAAVIGAVIPLFEGKNRWTSTHLFNTALIVCMAVTSGLAYTRLCGGLLPIPEDGTSPGQLLLWVGLPLLVADIVGMVVNAVLLAVMIQLRGAKFRYVLSGAIRQTALLYLGYTVLAFLFVVLWGPGQLYELSVALIMAPLLIARWSYVQFGEEFRAHNRILDTLATAGDGWDHGGAGHGTRVDQYTQLIAEQLGLTFSERRDLRYASKLHDIGRLGTPRHVLDKPMAARDEHDRALIRRHPLLAAEIVGGIAFLAEAARAIRHHHERPDGRGYPDGLAGEQLPMVARVIAVADAYDAMTSGAGPLAALEPEEALGHLRARAGTQFDPRCVEALGHVVGRTVEIIEHARRVHDDGPWRDHDDPRLGELMFGVFQKHEPVDPLNPAGPG